MNHFFCIQVNVFLTTREKKNVAFFEFNNEIVCFETERIADSVEWCDTILTLSFFCNFFFLLGIYFLSFYDHLWSREGRNSRIRFLWAQSSNIEFQKIVYKKFLYV